LGGVDAAGRDRLGYDGGKEGSIPHVDMRLFTLCDMRLEQSVGPVK